MTDTRPPHDYARSRAVLLGTWGYSHLPPVPAARHSLERIERVLTGPLCGWPRERERIKVIPNPSRRSNLPDQLMRLFDGVIDVALFYFVGHGQLHGDELCLALGNSPLTGPRRLTTGLPFTDVRNALSECDARTKIVILDCCFSGIATKPDNTLAAAADVISMTVGTGAFTMAASGAYQAAWFDPSPDASGGQTYFTKYFADTIERGLPGHPAGLALGPLFTATAEALANDHLPRPTRSVRDTADQFILARNRAAQRGRADALAATPIAEPEIPVTKPSEGNISVELSTAQGSPSRADFGQSTAVPNAADQQNEAVVSSSDKPDDLPGAPRTEIVGPRQIRNRRRLAVIAASTAAVLTAAIAVLADSPPGNGDTPQGVNGNAAHTSSPRISPPGISTGSGPTVTTSATTGGTMTTSTAAPHPSTRGSSPGSSAHVTTTAKPMPPIPTKQDSFHDAANVDDVVLVDTDGTVLTARSDGSVVTDTWQNLPSQHWSFQAYNQAGQPTAFSSSAAYHTMSPLSAPGSVLYVTVGNAAEVMGPGQGVRDQFLEYWRDYLSGGASTRRAINAINFGECITGHHGVGGPVAFSACSDYTAEREWSLVSP